MVSEQLRRARELVAERRRARAVNQVPPELVTFGQEGMEEFLERDERENPRLFDYDEKLNVIRVYWGGYDYEVDLDEVTTPMHLLRWVAHLAEKAWPLTTPRRIRQFIKAVCAKKGWDLYGDGPTGGQP